MEARLSEGAIGADDVSELRTEEVVCEECFSKIESPWERAKSKVDG